MANQEELYGKSPAQMQSAENYSSPEEYADQGDSRVVRYHSFRYYVATKDAQGNTQLSSVTLPRDSNVSVDQIGKIALMQGERDHAFYTTEELEKREKGTTAEVPSESNLSEAGEYELAEYLKSSKDGKAPTINEVLEAVGGDKDLAHRMLQAENIATDGDPRKGLEQGLTAIIEEG